MKPEVQAVIDAARWQGACGKLTFQQARDLRTRLQRLDLPWPEIEPAEDVIAELSGDNGDLDMAVMLQRGLDEEEGSK